MVSMKTNWLHGWYVKPEKIWFLERDLAKSGAEFWCPNFGTGENLVSMERFGEFWWRLSSWFRTRRDRCGESQLGHATDTGGDEEDHRRITGSQDHQRICNIVI